MKPLQWFLAFCIWADDAWTITAPRCVNQGPRGRQTLETESSQLMPPGCTLSCTSRFLPVCCCGLPANKQLENLGCHSTLDDFCFHVKDGC